MNFFDDDFGLSSSPVYPSRKGPPAVQQGSIAGDQMSRKSNKSGKKDQFDDLLDDLLSKQQKKQNKKKQRDAIAPYSSTQLDFISPSPQIDLKRTQKWSTPNIELNRLNQSPKFPKSRINSLEDRGSEDGKSYKSGFTGRPQPIQFDNLMTLRGPELQQKEEPIVQRSTRNMMRPPLAKNPNKDSSVMNDDISIKFGMPGSTTNLQFAPDRTRSRSREGRSVAPENKSGGPENRSIEARTELRSISPEKSVTPEVKQRVIEREKVVTVREQATQLKSQFENQMKQIKASFQRQLKETRQKWQEQIQQSKKEKEKLKRQYEVRLQEERVRLAKLNDENILALKSLHEWQLKKKSQSYQLQIQKLKSFSKLEETITKQQNNFVAGQQALQFKAKERQLQLEKKSLEDLRVQLKQREKTLEFQEQNFQNYRKKQEDKLLMEKRSMFEKQNQLKRTEMEQKRVLTVEKQKLASELANSELQLLKKKENLNLQREELRIARELFEKERSQYQQFNKNIINQYKNKLKEVDVQKEKINQLEIQLYKKIHVVDLTTVERGTSHTNNKQRSNSIRPSTANQENHRYRTNTFTSGWAQETKERYREMEAMARKNTSETEGERLRGRQKMNLEGYINRLNRAISRH